MRLHFLSLGLASLCAAVFSVPAAPRIPVAYETDVVVVGGSCGAVAAAVEAAKSGAGVFLMAPKPYLGDDMVGTMRLWLEPGEVPATPLARELYFDRLSTPFLSGAGIPFTYTADQPSDARHKDTPKPSRLSQSEFKRDAQLGSVQYNADVTITADLKTIQDISDAQVLAFAGHDYHVGRILVQVSQDNEKWTAVKPISCDPEDETSLLSIPIKAKARYVKLQVKRTQGSSRILLGGIRFLSAAAPSVSDTQAAAAIRPMHIKTTLENALTAAGVNFLYGCYATEVLVDGAGKPCGVVMANGLGRQAIVGKVIIDATEHATVARLAGAQFAPFEAGLQTARWVNIAHTNQVSAGASVKTLPFTFQTKEGLARCFEYSLALSLANDSWPARAALEQSARDKTYVPSQLYAADEPFLIPGYAIKAVKQGPESWPGAAALDLDVLRPAGVEKLWVLNGYAAVPRTQADKLLRPIALMELGTRLGDVAGRSAKSLPKPAEAKVAPGPVVQNAYAGEVKEPLEGLRPLPAPPKLDEEARPLPVLGSYDVLVIGGGTSGSAAAIGAARQGAKTLVVENLYGLGGVGTLGMIGKYWYGNRVGIAAAFPQNPTEPRMEYLRSELRKAGGEIWFGCFGNGALVQGNRVIGAVVVTPYGRGAVLARTVIDGTGNADIAAAAGAETRFVEDNFALQQSHVPPREVGAFYLNGNIPAVDVADPLNVRMALQGRTGNYFDRGQLVDSRERRRVVGDYCLDWLDVANHRTFPDTIAQCTSDYDSHGYQVHPYFALKPGRPPGNHYFMHRANLPYRCLLPRGLENILVIGLGLSAHRDAMPIVRMQPDLINSGYAAGIAAAMACKAQVTPRQIDVKALQASLIKVGNLPPTILNDTDSGVFPLQKVQAAVESVRTNFDGLEIVMASSQQSLPLLRQAYAQATSTNKLIYAEVLGVMGDATGIDTLVSKAQQLTKEVPAAKTESSLDTVTQLIWALGNPGDRRAVPVLASLAQNPAIRNGFNRYRAITVSLGHIADPAGAPTLAAFVSENREADLKKLLAACALYRCGDKDNLARASLEQFARSPNAPFARLAWQVLTDKRTTVSSATPQ